MNLLLEHLERSLGRYEGKGRVEPEWNVPFSVLRFDDVPSEGVATQVTFGLSDHILVGADRKERRQELLVSLRQADVALDLLVSTGMYLLGGHLALLEGETVSIPAELQGSLRHLVVAHPDHLDPALAQCDTPDFPVELVWLLPFAVAESHVAVEHGWRDLLDWIREEGADPFDLERPSLVA